MLQNITEHKTYPGGPRYSDGPNRNQNLRNTLQISSKDQNFLILVIIRVICSDYIISTPSLTSSLAKTSLNCKLNNFVFFYQSRSLPVVNVFWIRYDLSPSQNYMLFSSKHFLKVSIVSLFYQF